MSDLATIIITAHERDLPAYAEHVAAQIEEGYTSGHQDRDHQWVILEGRLDLDAATEPAIEVDSEAPAAVTFRDDEWDVEAEVSDPDSPWVDLTLAQHEGEEEQPTALAHLSLTPDAARELAAELIAAADQASAAYEAAQADA